MTQSALIFGCEGPQLSAAEAAFFRDVQPFGFILFARNITDPAQLLRLTGALREAVGRDVPITIDQEGGRVQRMRAPHWREYLPALDQMAQARDPMRAQWLRNRLIAAELRAVGIDSNAAPLADLVEPQTHPVLRNRLYGSDVETVVTAARAAGEGLLAGGVLPILKHLPGYGRASVDSHLELPRVSVSREALFERDFAPFKALNDFAIGMTAHIVYEAIDPERAATVSPVMIELIRQEIGFDGLMMSDDIGMEALKGTLAERAAATFAAGVDLVLECSGVLDNMMSVAEVSVAIDGARLRRAEAALATRRAPEAIDEAALWDELQGRLGNG